jgi:hypothetical protein
MNARYRVSYSFATLSDNDLITFLQVVIICLTNNTAFTSLPVTLVDLQALLTTFQNAVNAMGQSNSSQLTAERDEARVALLDAFRKTGAYVQSVALNSLSTLLSSGFAAVSAPSGQTPLPAPSVVSVSNLATTQVLMRLTPIPNARSYESRLSLDNGVTWTSGGISPQARRIILGSLTPGKVYMIAARAIGGSTGQSDWSTPVTIMAT